MDRRLAYLEAHGILDDNACVGVTIEIKLLPGKAEPKRVLTHPLLEDREAGDGRPDDEGPASAAPRRPGVVPGPSGPRRGGW